MRKNIFEGDYYEADFEKLDEEINRCFTSRFGPGDLPIKRHKKIKGIITPNDKYKLSGGGMAWSYKEIAEAEFSKTYVILGVNSKKLGRKFACSLENWESVFGSVRVDVELANKLMEKSELKVDEEVQIRESCIEVQLPFLQFVNKDKLKELFKYTNNKNALLYKYFCVYPKDESIYKKYNIRKVWTNWEEWKSITKDEVTKFKNYIFSYI